MTRKQQRPRARPYPYNVHRRDPRKSGGFPFKTIAAMAAVPLILIGGGVAGMNHYLGVEKPDALGCLARPDQAQVAVLLDASLGQLQEAQIRDYRAGFADAYANAPANAKVSIFATTRDAQGSVIQPVFSGCKPAATPTEQAALGAPDKPAPYLAREAAKARAAFEAAVSGVIADAQSPDQRAGDSPILEMVAAVSRHADFAGGGIRSLTLITDGIQNTPSIQFCASRGHMPRFAVFAKSPGYRDLAPRSFEGADVSVLLVETARLPQPGLDHCTHAEMRSWWRDYFEGNGAASVALTPLRFWAGS